MVIIIELDKPIKPIGIWNTINPLSKDNKEYKRLNKIWFNKNSTHIDKIKILISNILKITSHIIGILITVFFTSTPWLIPKIDILMGIGSYSNNTFYFSWPDHFALTLFPMFSHIGLNLITKLGNYGKLIKYGLITIPIIITSPYLIYQYQQIKKHKKECNLCKQHSNKIQIEKVE
ncbi:hypothetical protein [Spiroplasma endosymbiont of Virgichneumon dumeticola]|uniref:hypothetical protein n=1 Tax=Spiroplasma endosymbiont of Virgichneumon dumeticola TaxID=3139323 RepID=UPI0035C8EE8A